MSPGRNGNDRRHRHCKRSLCHGQALFLPGAPEPFPEPGPAGHRALRLWKYPHRGTGPFPGGRGSGGAEKCRRGTGSGASAERHPASAGGLPPGAVLLHLLRCRPGHPPGGILVSGEGDREPDRGPKLGDCLHPQGGGKGGPELSSGSGRRVPGAGAWRCDPGGGQAQRGPWLPCPEEVDPGREGIHPEGRRQIGAHCGPGGTRRGGYGLCRLPAQGCRHAEKRSGAAVLRGVCQRQGHLLLHRSLCGYGVPAGKAGLPGLCPAKGPAVPGDRPRSRPEAPGPGPGAGGGIRGTEIPDGP